MHYSVVIMPNLFLYPYKEPIIRNKGEAVIRRRRRDMGGVRVKE